MERETKDANGPMGLATSIRTVAPWFAAGISAALLYLTGPTVNAWPLTFAALVPLIWVARTELVVWKRPVYLAFFMYFFVSLQGLRHAHPLMILPLIALSAYLALYPLWFVACLKRYPTTGRLAGLGGNAVWPAVIWVGGEWIRNYFATGISVLMLGHSLADMPGPRLIQIADLLGTYGVSFTIVVVNAAIADTAFAFLAMRSRDQTRAQISPDQQRRWKASLVTATLLIIAVSAYGSMRLDYEPKPSQTTLMLVGRDEQTEYQQDVAREIEIFRAYATQSIDAVADQNQVIDAVVWPESMLSGGQAWLIAESNLVVPSQPGDPTQKVSVPQFRSLIAQTQADFTSRAIALQAAMKQDGRPTPSLIGGCGVVRYGETPRQFSGVVHVDSEGHVAGVYAKNHLVMFGEYIPLIKSIPILRDFVPPGLGLDAGQEPQSFQIGDLKVLPNLCIETAVERIAVNHLADLRDARPDVIVTLTNDVWFDHSAVVSHHLRCAQMVAIGCRTPILSAANGGPTAWIDSAGRVVKQLPFDKAGTIIASPGIDSRMSLYTRIGSWPAGLAAFALIATTVRAWWLKRRV